MGFEPKAIKFGKQVREINRAYEQNNNAELDNGIINQVIQEQDKAERRALASSDGSLEEELIQLT